MEETKTEDASNIQNEINNKESRLGSCEVCSCSNAKYTCPRCEVKTCSLKCNKIHKLELECDGTRDKTKFIPLKKMTNLDLSSDYRMLEEITRNIESCRKTFTRKFYNTNRDLPNHLYKLKQQAGVYKTNIKFLPYSFIKRKQNTTFLHFKRNLIYWHIEWVFVNADNLKMVDNKVLETEKLGNALHKYFIKQDDVVIQEKLAYYQACDITGVKVFLKAEQCSGNRYYEVDLSETVRECLRDKTIVEYPTFYVVLKEHAHIFDVIGMDVSSNIQSNSAIVDNIIKSAEAEDDINSSLRNLLFASDEE